MVGRNHLRKVSWLGDVGLVTADTERGGVELGGLERTGVVGVAGQRPVAGFTVDPGVLAVLFCVENIGATGFTGLVTGKGGRSVGNFSEGIAAVVPVLSEAVRDHEAASDEKQDQADGENRRQAEQVAGIPSQFIQRRDTAHSHR